MLDNDNRTARINQAFQDLEQLMDISHMKSRRWLIQDIERPSRIGLGEFRRKFDALRLPAGQGRRRLSQADIAQAHIFKDLEFLQDSLMVAEIITGFRNGHVKDIRNILALIMDLKRIPIISRAPTDFTGDIDIGKGYNSNYFSVCFPLKAWRVPVWSFDYFCSPYMDGRMRIVMVEDNALLEEVSVVGYGTTRNSSLTGNLRIRGANQPMFAAKEDSGNAVEVKYVPAQVAEDAVEDVVFESETIPVGEALQPIEGLRTNFAETAFFILNFVQTNKGSLRFLLRCRRA